LKFFLRKNQLQLNFSKNGSLSSKEIEIFFKITSKNIKYVYQKTKITYSTLILSFFSVNIIYQKDNFVSARRITQIAKIWCGKLQLLEPIRLF